MSHGNRSHTLRIIGGKWRGRKVHVPKATSLRPTPDRVRETLFNWLMHSVASARCIDLFAGSGILGLEALSRGAAHVHFFDVSPKATRHIRDVLSTLEADNAKVTQMDVLRHAIPFNEQVDILFLDPPFRRQLAQRCIELLSTSGLLKDDALIYLEVESEHDPITLPENWLLLKQKQAGQVSYSLIQHQGTKT